MQIYLSRWLVAVTLALYGFHNNSWVVCLCVGEDVPRGTAGLSWACRHQPWSQRVESGRWRVRESTEGPKSCSLLRPSTQIHFVWWLISNYLTCIFIPSHPSDLSPGWRPSCESMCPVLHILITYSSGLHSAFSRMRPPWRTSGYDQRYWHKPCSHCAQLCSACFNFTARASF